MEIKKSYRLDGICVPANPELPVYFVEVQFQRIRKVYANLFAKVFSYLDANDPDQEWMALALFLNRAIEPKGRGTYDYFLASPRVRRFYLDELEAPAGAPAGLAILQLIAAPKSETAQLVSQVVRKTRAAVASERPVHQANCGTAGGLAERGSAIGGPRGPVRASACEPPRSEVVARAEVSKARSAVAAAATALGGA